MTTTGQNHDADRTINIPEAPVPGLTYGAHWDGGLWISSDGIDYIRGRTRPDLVLVDTIAADDHEAAIRGEVTAAEIISAACSAIEESWGSV